MGNTMLRPKKKKKKIDNDVGQYQPINRVLRQGFLSNIFLLYGENIIKYLEDIR